jgi:hypothetical protein
MVEGELVSLTAKLKEAVELGFAAAGDLKKIATLTPKNPTGYDWSNNTVTAPNEAVKTAEILFYTESRGKDTTVQSKAIIRSADFDRSLYEKITVEGEDYYFENYQDYIVIAELELRRA